MPIVLAMTRRCEENTLECTGRQFGPRGFVWSACQKCHCHHSRYRIFYLEASARILLHYVVVFLRLWRRHRRSLSFSDKIFSSRFIILHTPWPTKTCHVHNYDKCWPIFNKSFTVVGNVVASMQRRTFQQNRIFAPPNSSGTGAVIIKILGKIQRGSRWSCKLNGREYEKLAFSTNASLFSKTVQDMAVVTTENE